MRLQNAGYTAILLYYSTVLRNELQDRNKTCFLEKQHTVCNENIPIIKTCIGSLFSLRPPPINKEHAPYKTG